MKRLLIFIGAGLLVMAMASVALASSGNGWSSGSLDPMGHAWIKITPPSHSETAPVAPNVVYLDSNRLWAAQNPWPVAREGVLAQKTPTGKFICFDSAKLSCAVSD